MAVWKQLSYVEVSFGLDLLTVHLRSTWADQTLTAQWPLERGAGTVVHECSNASQKSN